MNHLRSDSIIIFMCRSGGIIFVLPFVHRCHDEESERLKTDENLQRLNLVSKKRGLTKVHTVGEG